MKKQIDDNALSLLLSSAENEENQKITKTDYDEEERKEKIEKLKAANKLIRENIEDIQQNRSERKFFARRIFDFLCIYMYAVLFILLLCGITVNHFHLSENVLITLLGTTTIDVMALFAIVARYLFPNRK